MFTKMFFHCDDLLSYSMGPTSNAQGRVEYNDHNTRDTRHFRKQLFKYWGVKLMQTDIYIIL